MDFQALEEYQVLLDTLLTTLDGRIEQPHLIYFYKNYIGTVPSLSHNFASSLGYHRLLHTNPFLPGNIMPALQYCLVTAYAVLILFFPFNGLCKIKKNLICDQTTSVLFFLPWSGFHQILH